MDAVEALTRLGGIADAWTIGTLVSRRRLRTAVAGGHVVRLARGAYALPTTEAGRAAARLHGARSHLSAAAHCGWEVKWPEARPHVTVPRGRNVAQRRRVGVSLHWRPLSPDEIRDGVTTPLRTVLDCARDLPRDEALAVADSALRHGGVTPERLRAAAAGLTGRNAAGVRWVATYADGRAEKPFESVLRCLAIEEGLDVVPQHAVVAGGLVLHPDLVDVRRRLVLEADSWTWHADRDTPDRDCWRYNALVLVGWTVLRFTWDQVMHRPAGVRTALRTAAGAAGSDRRTGLG